MNSFQLFDNPVEAIFSLQGVPEELSRSYWGESGGEFRKRRRPTLLFSGVAPGVSAELFPNTFLSCSFCPSPHLGAVHRPTLAQQRQRNTLEQCRMSTCPLSLYIVFLTPSGQCPGPPNNEMAITSPVKYATVPLPLVANCRKCRLVGKRISLSSLFGLPQVPRSHGFAAINSLSRLYPGIPENATQPGNQRSVQALSTQRTGQGSMGQTQGQVPVQAGKFLKRFT
jgi:hypothetical protein